MLTIDIGSRNIKIVYADPTPKNVSVKSQILLETPENAVSNGLVTDFDSVVEAIRETLEEYEVKEKRASVVITSPEIIIREIKLPKTDPKNIDMIVYNEVESFLGEDNYKVEYFLQTQEDGVIRAYTFGIPTRVSESYRKMLLQIGLVPVALDVGPNTIRKLVSWGNLIKQSGEQRMDVIADIGYNFINFNIFEKKTLVYSRCVRIDADEAVKMHVDSLQERTKRELEQDANFATYLGAVGDEIQRILQFLISSDFRVKETKLFICGGAANFAGMPDLLHDYLNAGVHLMESRRSPTFRDESLKEFINALGAQVRL